jgi:hypothetical protein
MARRLIPILVAALAVTGVTATGGVSSGPGPESIVPVLAQTVDSGHLLPGDVPPGMTVVFLPPAGDGFSDGGDGPGGLEWLLGDGFSDGGDVPEGYVAVAALQADDAFWRLGLVPEGLIPVLGEIPGDGFSDGGDLPDGFVPVLFRSVGLRGPGS